MIKYFQVQKMRKDNMQRTKAYILREAPLQIIFSPFFFLLTVAIVFATDVEAEISLVKAIEMAAVSEPIVLIERKNIESKELELQTLREEVYPSLGLSVDSGVADVSGGSIALTLTQVLYDWGLLQSEIQAATQEKIIATTFLKTELENLALEMGTLFIEVQFIEERMRVTKEFIEQIAKIFEQVQQRAQSGVGDNAEVARTRLELGRAEEQFLSLSQERDILLTQIAFKIGAEVDGIQAPPVLNLTNRYGALPEIQAIVSLSPEVIQAQAARAASEANVAKVKASRLPTIQLKAQARRDVGLGRTRSSIGLSTDLNLNTGSFGRRAIEIAQAELESSELALASIKKKKIFQFQTSLKELTALSRELSARERQMRTSEEVIRSYEQQFEIGQRELIDLLNTQRDLYDAMIERIDIMEAEKQKSYEIIAGVGALGSLVSAVSGGSR